MAGVVEDAVFTGVAVSFAPAKNTSNPPAANAAGIKDTLRIALYPQSNVGDVNLISAVPADEANEKTSSHDGKSQVDVPAVQLRCRNDRAQGGKDQQQGRLALRQSVLFDHSLFTSRLCNAHSASRRRFFPALSSRQLSAQVHNLPYMMIRMAHRTNKNLEAIGGFRFTVGSVRLSPVRCSLFLNCRHDHGNRAVERA